MCNEQSNTNDSIRLRDKLLYYLSHETKGMFANIFWIIEAIEHSFFDKEMLQAMLPELKSVAQKNLEEYNDTLNWIKVQQDGFNPILAPVNISALYNRLKHFFERELISQNRKIIFEGDDNIVVISDEELLRFILKETIHKILIDSYSEKNIIFKVLKSTDENILIITINTTNGANDTSIKSSKEILQHKMLHGILNNNTNLCKQFIRDILPVLNATLKIVSDPDDCIQAILTIPVS